ncbi:phosphoribosylglycinamide formyltransferase [Candidatus Daviesbacteria bacterium]|nr:phosphoribosylglycinamide formyltransferase [Candidatus Daviesbacteria bacterium]
MERISLAILASGGGTTAEAIIKSRVVDVVLVICNNADAGVVEKAKRLDVPVEIMPRAPFKVFKNGEEDVMASRLKYGEALLDKLSRYNVTHISQNGWMILTPPNVVKEFTGRIVNQHPGPLDPGYPDFGGQGMYGLRVHAAVLNFVRGVKRPFSTAATIHQVNEIYDKGDLVATSKVKIMGEDSPEELAARVLPVEHRLQIDFWKDAALGIVTCNRTSRLILPEEYSILERAKKLAIEQYPKG